ncbi:MAG: DUF4190 domain-containing protein, partial [Acidimicrobiia bacterium]
TPPPPPPPPPPSTPPPSAGGPPGWQQPPPARQQPAPGYATAPQTEGTAVAALVLAIASFVVCPLVPAIVALVLAHTAQQKIDASGGRLTGDSLNTAARIIAWIHIGLVVVGVVAVIVVAATVGFDSNDDDDFDFDSLRTVGTYLAARFG